MRFIIRENRTTHIEVSFCFERYITNILATLTGFASGKDVEEILLEDKSIFTKINRYYLSDLEIPHYMGYIVDEKWDE